MNKDIRHNTELKETFSIRKNQKTNNKVLSSISYLYIDYCVNSKCISFFLCSREAHASGEPHFPVSEVTAHPYHLRNDKTAGFLFSCAFHV